jgi:hypothetical protein
MSHGQTWTHRTHHGPDLGEATTFPPYSILCASPRGPHPNSILSKDSQVRVSKFSRLGLSQLWGHITLCANLRWRWGVKKNYSPRQDLSNYMLHATWKRGNQGDSQLLVVGSRIAKLTPDLTSNPSFGHNLCFRCPNGSCQPISDIYIPISFSWYEELLNLLSFDPCNCSLKI